MKELKDCPFCGGNGELNLTEINQALQINTVGQAFVECVDCGSNGEIFNNFDNDINKGVLIVNKAISNWNTRNSVSINAI